MEALTSFGKAFYPAAVDAPDGAALLHHLHIRKPMNDLPVLAARKNSLLHRDWSTGRTSHPRYVRKANGVVFAAVTSASAPALVFAGYSISESPLSQC
jgi:hypothetical protein